MSAITSHVLDTAKGKPANGVGIRLDFLSGNDTWTTLAEGVTDADGRIKDLLPEGAAIEKGTYKMCFETGPYLGDQGFYPFAQVVFKVDDPTQHYHVPLLLSPYGYSTYRGS